MVHEISQTQELSNRLRITTQKANTPPVTYVPAGTEDEDDEPRDDTIIFEKNALIAKPKPKPPGEAEDNIPADPQNAPDEAELAEINHISAADNKNKLILYLVMSVLLVFASFGLRFFMTGSFLIKGEKEAVFTSPATYEELAQRLIEAGDYTSPVFGNAVNYRLENRDIPRKSLLFNERYIFNIIENTLYVVEIRSGSVTQVAGLEFTGEVIREIHLLGDELYVVSVGEYSGSYHHIEETPAEAEGAEPVIEVFSGDFTQDTVTVRSYNAFAFTKQPKLEFTVDGLYADIIINKDRLILSTHYTPHDPRAHSDLSAFVPAYTVSGETKHIAMNNIYAPPAKLMNAEITVISVVSAGDVSVHAAVGGSGYVYAGETALFVTLGSRLIKPGINIGEEPGFFDAGGIIPRGALHEGYGLIRFGADSSKGARLYVMNAEMELISVVENIGGDDTETLHAVLFDRSRVYLLSDKLYAFDTSQPADIMPANEPFSHVYADNFYRLSDDKRLEVTIETPVYASTSILVQTSPLRT
jgi:hypothetical protein